MLKKSVTLYWDLNVERLTLGGALVLRQEGEILAAGKHTDTIDLYIDFDPSISAFPKRIADIVFQSSSLIFNIHHGKPLGQSYWPTKELIVKRHFSYYSFSRLISFYEYGGRPVRLKWKKQLIKQAKQVRNMFGKKLICIHLKRVAPYDIKESNAQITEWASFLRNNYQKAEFIIIGDDPIPAEIKEITGVVSASDMGLDIALQLCLIHVSDGFIGMASGICNAANFSNVPNIIFKHPEHHVEDMLRELGDKDTFNFSGKHQFLWRTKATEKKLEEALNIITDNLWR